MMKKYWGNRYWNDSLYLVIIFDDQTQEERKGFCYGAPFDWKRMDGFPDRNVFEDMNSFITFQEHLDSHQCGKI